MRLEDTLRPADAPAVLSRDLLSRMARSARAGQPVPPSSLTYWLRHARAAGSLVPVVQGLYLNRYRRSPGLLADAAHALVPDAVVSLNTVLGDAGVLNNPSAIVTAVAPIDRGAPPPKLGRRITQAGTIHYYGLPRRILEAGLSEDRLEAVTTREHARATAEKALLDWLYLAESPRSRRTLPPKSDVDLDRLDRGKLKRLAVAMGLKEALSRWLKS